MPSLASGPSGITLPTASPVDECLEGMANVKRSVVFHAERPRFGAHSHAKRRQREDDDEPVADLAELSEYFARTCSLQGVDEKKHAHEGADRGQGANSRACRFGV